MLSAWTEQKIGNDPSPSDFEVHDCHWSGRTGYLCSDLCTEELAVKFALYEMDQS